MIMSDHVAANSSLSSLLSSPSPTSLPSSTSLQQPCQATSSPLSSTSTATQKPVTSNTWPSPSSSSSLSSSSSSLLLSITLSSSADLLSTMTSAKNLDTVQHSQQMAIQNVDLHSSSATLSVLPSSSLSSPSSLSLSLFSESAPSSLTLLLSSPDASLSSSSSSSSSSSPLSLCSASSSLPPSRGSLHVSNYIQADLRHQSVINLSLAKNDKTHHQGHQNVYERGNNSIQQQQQQQHQQSPLKPPQKRKRTAPTRYPLDVEADSSASAMTNCEFVTTKPFSSSSSSSSSSSPSSSTSSSPSSVPPATSSNVCFSSIPFSSSTSLLTTSSLSSSSSSSSFSSSLTTTTTSNGLPQTTAQQQMTTNDVIMDDDDDNDDEQDKFLPRNYDPERLKAFNMFVRLFVDENLDRVAPISKQPKEKIQAIIEACDRQFPEFKSRSRKRIRTYLKSCRRLKKTKGNCEDNRQTKSTLPHLTSAAAEAILAQACDNESNNAKRMRMGLEPLTAEQMQVSSLLANGQQQQQQQQQQSLPGSIQPPVNQTKTPPMAHSTYYVQSNHPCQSVNIYKTPGTTTSATTTNLLKTSNSPEALLVVHKSEPAAEDYQTLQMEPGTDQNSNSNRQPPSAHRPLAMTSHALVTQSSPTSATTTISNPFNGAAVTATPMLFAFSNANYSFPPTTMGSYAAFWDVASEKNRCHSQMMASSSGGVVTTSRLQNPFQQQQSAFQTNHYSLDSSLFDQCQTAPTDLSMKTQRRHSQVAHTPSSSYPSQNISQSTFQHAPSIRIRLTADEIATIKQLIVGYRESAAFLYRSAEELQQLINNNINNNIHI